VFRRQIFRQESLDRLSSPEELDHLLIVVRPRAWLPLLTLGLLCLAALVWSIFGRIPETVNGVGVLINPGHVKSIQAPATGQLIDLPIRVGQLLERGDTIGVLNQPELKQQLDQEQDRLRELVSFNRLQEELDGKRRQLEEKSIGDQRRLLREGIASAQSVLRGIEEKNASYQLEQRKNLKETRRLAAQLHESLTKKVDKLRSVREEKLVPEDVWLSAVTALNENEVQLANLNVREQELNVKEIESRQYILQQKNRIQDLQMQLQQLDLREKTVEQDFSRSAETRAHQVRESRRKIDQLQEHLARQSKILCPYPGRVLELTAAQGQLLPEGARVATVEVADSAAELKCLVYFAVKDGKRVKQGMPIRVTPANVQRERYGAIVGRVSNVSSFPISQDGAVTVLGSAEIARSLTAGHGGAVIEVEAQLDVDPHSYSGYRWTSKGPDLNFSAGTTAAVRVTVDERAPITFVLPVLQTWVFGAKDEALSP
jgi:HlyD family secretion protein